MRLKNVLASAVSVPIVVGVSVFAGPSPALAAGQWSVSHQTGSASGTAEYTYSAPTKRVTVAGQVTASAAGDCYRVQLVSHHDLVSWTTNVVDHCGTTTTPFTTGGSGSIVTSSFSVRLCRLQSGTVTGCSNLVRL